MPERTVCICWTRAIGANEIGFDHLLAVLKDGWCLEKQIHNGVIPLQDCVIYHLIKYSAEEIEQMQKEAEQRKSFSLKAASLISVPLADVDAKLKEGYEIIPDKIYAKEAVLIKYEKQQAGA